MFCRGCEIEDTEIFRTQAIKAARELMYGKEVVKKLEAAKTVGEMDRILKAVRKAKIEEGDIIWQRKVDIQRKNDTTPKKPKGVRL